MITSLWIMGILFILYFSFSFPAVLAFYFPNSVDFRILRLLKKQKDGTEDVEIKYLATGEVVLRTNKGTYYHAVDEDSVPVLISKDEGERLWKLADESEKQ